MPINAPDTICSADAVTLVRRSIDLTGRRTDARAWCGWVAASVLVHAGLAALWLIAPQRMPPAEDTMAIELSFSAPAAPAAAPAHAEPETQVVEPTMDPPAVEAPPVEEPPVEAPPVEPPAAESMPTEVPPQPPPPPEPAPEPPPEPKPEPPPRPAPQPQPAPPKPRPQPAPRPATAATEAQAQPPVAPTPVQAAAPAPPAPISATWRASLSSWLQQNKTYPEAARARGDQGSAAVRFTVNRDGQVSDVALVRGTGSALLDDAVLALLNKARLPAFPMDMTQQTITVTVQINYALQR